MFILKSLSAQLNAPKELRSYRLRAHLSIRGSKPAYLVVRTVRDKILPVVMFGWFRPSTVSSG